MAKVVGTMKGWAKSRTNTEAVDLTEIDPEGEVLMASEGASVRQVECDSLAEWVLMGRSLGQQGHILHPSDSRRNLMLGFVDAETNEAYMLPIRMLKEATDDEYEELGLTRSQMRTKTGRSQAIGADPFFQDGEAVHEPDPDLQAAWGHFRPYQED